MLEEFHGDQEKGYQQLYGWGTININVWLPSLIELVGFDPNTHDSGNGCYSPAMQRLNLTNWYDVDAQGGTQFAYFIQYNASGGGQKIWDACNRQQSWLRSTDYGNTKNAWCTTDTTNLNTTNPTGSRAVHPAVLYNPERPVKKADLKSVVTVFIMAHIS